MVSVNSGIGLSLLMGLSSCMASCLTEQTALSDLLLDCRVAMTVNAVFHIVFACLLCVCIRNGDLK